MPPRLSGAVVGLGGAVRSGPRPLYLPCSGTPEVPPGSVGLGPRYPRSGGPLCRPVGGLASGAPVGAPVDGVNSGGTGLPCLPFCFPGKGVVAPCVGAPVDGVGLAPNSTALPLCLPRSGAIGVAAGEPAPAGEATPAGVVPGVLVRLG